MQKSTMRYSTTAREPLLSSGVTALEARLGKLLDRIHEAEAAHAAKIRTMEQAVERLIGRLSPLSEVLTAKPLPVPTPAAPPRDALPSIYCSFPPPRPREEPIDTALARWLIAHRKRSPAPQPRSLAQLGRGRGRVRP